MATTNSIEKFRLAAKDYLNNERFSDFTILCEGKEFKVHRCFICMHSKWFERCCSGMFLEGQKSRVELKEDLYEIVEKMVTFCYTFDYDDHVEELPPETHSRRPSTPLQVNAFVYAIAEKYDIMDLKALVLEKFKQHADVTDADAMLRAAWTIYKDIQLPENDRSLHNLILDMWLLGGKPLVVNMGDHNLESYMVGIPEFMARVYSRLMRGSDFKLKQACRRCGRYELVERKDITTKPYTACRACGGTEASENVSWTSSLLIKRYW